MQQQDNNFTIEGCYFFNSTGIRSLARLSLIPAILFLYVSMVNPKSELFLSFFLLAHVAAFSVLLYRRSPFVVTMILCIMLPVAALIFLDKFSTEFENLESYSE